MGDFAHCTNRVAALNGLNLLCGCVRGALLKGVEALEKLSGRENVYAFVGLQAGSVFIEHAHHIVFAQALFGGFLAHF
jgi:hypothetical protein